MDVIIPLIDEDKDKYSKSPYTSRTSDRSQKIYALKITHGKEFVSFYPLGAYSQSIPNVYFEFPKDPERLRKLADVLREIADDSESEQEAERNKGDGENDE